MKKVLKIILVFIMIMGVAFSAYNFISVEAQANTNITGDYVKSGGPKTGIFFDGICESPGDECIIGPFKN